MLRRSQAALSNLLEILIIKIKIIRLKLLKAISLKPQGRSSGNVLIAYLQEPFLMKRGDLFPNTHSSFWECWQIAQTFLSFGYCVDVIHFSRRDFIPRKRYDFFLDIRYTMDAIAPRLNSDCIKILHADTAYIPVHNAAEAKRLQAIQKRRNVALSPRRFEEPTPAVEYVDLITVLGNQFTIDSYRSTNKPVHRLAVSVPEEYSWQDKDFTACRKSFLWFGSWGLVHKGLDLVLEAFAEMPEYDLTVCGPIQKEPDFEQAYHRELYQTPNIHTIGWVDTSSSEFLEIVKRCVGLVYPTCSEGGGSSVLTCMHTGLIPIVSYESSVDVDASYGVILKDSSIDQIKAAVQQVVSQSPEQLQQMARNAWEFARENHTRDRFAESYLKFAQHLVSTRFRQQQHEDFSIVSKFAN